MRLLLDSHVLLWSLFEPRLVSRPVADIIDDPAATVLVSPITVYELELKKSKGRLPFPDVQDWTVTLAAAGYTLAAPMPGVAKHAAGLAAHHKDPWDRFIVAQALFEGAALATKDTLLGRYGVATLW